METVAGEFRGDALLSANLEYLAMLDPPATRPVLPRLPGGAGPLPADFQLESTDANTRASIILQVNAVEDVSFPLAQRLRIMVGEEEEEEAGQEEGGGEVRTMTVEETLRSMENDEPGAQRRGRRQRLLRLTVTDGFTRVIAIEDCCKGCTALRDGVAWGAKLQLFAPLQIRHGVIILTSETTVMLGGFLPELQAFWLQHAKATLEKMSGKTKKKKSNIKENSENVGPIETAALVSFPISAASFTANAEVSVCNTVAENYERQSRNLQEAVGQRQQQQQPVTYPRSQPLSAWRLHHPPTSPFTTTAVISEVTSELTIRKDAVFGVHESPKFSLLVLLSSPPSSTRTTAAAATNGNTARAELVVDLGHDWLQQAIGMDPDAFSALSVSRHPDDVARLNALVESIGWRLENFGVAVFVLLQRRVGHVIEVIHVSPLEGIAS